jgi:hypothetical protein
VRWLAATIALLGASVFLVLGIYLRDRAPGQWLPPQRLVAHSDAMAVAAAIGGTCPRDCTVKLLGHPRKDHWIERIVIPTATRCVDINVLAFATDETHGIAGVTEVRCGADS